MAAENIMIRDPPLATDLLREALQFLHKGGAKLACLIVTAVQQHRPDEVVLLFEICLGERGVRIKSRGFGNEPMRKKLIRAAEKGDIDEITKLLRKLKLCPNSRDGRNGWSAAHHAAALGHVEVLRHLKMYKADLNMKNNDGAVPLHYATNSAVHVLRELGCSVSVVDANGQTPLMLAKKREAQYGQLFATGALDPRVAWSEIDAVLMGNMTLDDMIRELVKLGFGSEDASIFVMSDHGKVVNPSDELQLRNQLIQNGSARGRLLCTKLLCPLLALAGERSLCDDTNPPLPRLSFCKYLLQQKIPSFAPAEVFTCARANAEKLEVVAVGVRAS